jgi:flagellar protein FlaG
LAPEAVSVGLSEAARQELEKFQAKTGPQAGSAPMSVEDAAKAFQEYLKNLPSDLQFQPDKESGYVIFKVVNPLTHEVIRQYPPEEMVKMARYLKAAANQGKSGILLDRKS